jgi:hypothetical protein
VVVVGVFCLVDVDLRALLGDFRALLGTALVVAGAVTPRPRLL